ncbi:hypothetical protein FOCC_FOCC000904 [Frankliniella occidentalis]|nr:hypothetical protein FOCC_FOCC000904 [Frankliniella occidentalis]
MLVLCNLWRAARGLRAMEPHLCQEKKGALNDTGQSSADGAETPPSHPPAVEEVAISDQYGLKTDRISGGDSQEAAPVPSGGMPLSSNGEESVLVATGDISCGENSESSSPVSDVPKSVDMLKASGAGDSVEDCRNYSEMNSTISPGNKDIEHPHDDDMDPLITIDDTESQSSDLINFDTVSYDVIQQPAEDDDEKSIATISSLSCDIKMDSPSKHSQGSNSSSLINLLDTSTKEVSVAPGSPSPEIVVEAPSSSASSCHSSPLHLSSKTASSAVEGSFSQMTTNSEDANACGVDLVPNVMGVAVSSNIVLSHEDRINYVDNEDSFGNQSVISEPISHSPHVSPSSEDVESLDQECISHEPSLNCQSLDDAIQSAAQLDTCNVDLNGGNKDIHNHVNISLGKDVKDSQEITPADFRSTDIEYKDLVPKSNMVDDSCIVLAPTIIQEKCPLSEAQIQKDSASDSTIFESLMTDSASTGVTTFADSSSLDNLILQETSEKVISLASVVSTFNEVMSPTISSEDTSIISSTSDIPAIAHIDDVTTTVTSSHNEDVQAEEISSSPISLINDVINITTTLEEEKNFCGHTETKEPTSSVSSRVDSMTSNCVSLTDKPAQTKGCDNSNETQDEACFKPSLPDLYQLVDEIENADNPVLNEDLSSLADGPVLLTTVEAGIKEDLSPVKNMMPSFKIKTTSEAKDDSENIADDAFLINTASSADMSKDLDSDKCTENMKDLNLETKVTETVTKSMDAVPLLLENSTGQIKRPTSLPNIDSNNLQAKQTHSMSFSDFMGLVTATNTGPAISKQYNASLLDNAQQIASSLVDDILGTAILKAEETLISSANSTSNRVEAVSAAHTLINQVLNRAVAQVSSHNECKKEMLENSNVKDSPKDVTTEPLILPEPMPESIDRRPISPPSVALLPVVCSVDQPLSDYGQAEEDSTVLDHEGEHGAGVDPSSTETEIILSNSNDNLSLENLTYDKDSPEVYVVEEFKSPTLKHEVGEPEDGTNPPASEPFLEQIDAAMANLELNLKSNDKNIIDDVPQENSESSVDFPFDGPVEISSSRCTSPTSEHAMKAGEDGSQMVADLPGNEDISSLSNTSSELDLKINGRCALENPSGEISKSNSLVDVNTKEESGRTSSSENGNSDSARSSLLTCSDLGIRSEASIFVDGVLEEAVKKYEESSSSESSPMKLKGLVLDPDFLQEDEELATPCGEMLTEHFMDFESGRNVSVFCSIPDNPSDDHLLAYDRIAHTIGNREVDSDTGKSVSVFRIEDDVYYEIQRASTCTSVFESVEEEDEDMVDTTVPLEDRPTRKMRTSASFPSFDKDKLDFSDDPLKADSDAFEDAVGAFLAKERLVRDERKHFTAIGGNINPEENTCRALVLRHPEYDLSNQEEKKRMAEKWANGVPDTPEMREKQRLIREVLESDEDVPVKLCKLALTEGGLINDTLRREAWPRMLGLDPTLEVDAPLLEDLKSHPEYGQVVLDVNRSLKRFPPDIPADQRETLQDKLTRLIMYVISKHPHLRYYQGYHDVAVTFLLVVGESVAFQIMERLSTENLSDCMQPTMERTSYLLHFIYPLLHRLHPTLAEYLERSEVGTMFCLPWFLTWFGHSLDRYQDVVRLYDHFLASPPLAPLYVAAVLVAHRADEVLAVDCDMAAIHALLSHIPDTLPLEILLRDATELYFKFPPESIEREVEERFKNEQQLRVHEMEAREKMRQRLLRRRRGHRHGSWQLAEVHDRIGGTMMTLNRWMPPWVVQQQRLSMRLLFASATFFVGFYVYSRGGDMLPYM